MIVQFKNYKCKAVGNYYTGGGKAIQLIDVEDGSPVATATVNVPSADIPEDEVFIKEYSENGGMTDALIEAGIISQHPRMHVESAFVTIISRRLTKQALEALWKN